MSYEHHPASVLSQSTEPYEHCPGNRGNHMAVRLDHNIVMFGGWELLAEFLSCREIWTYNLYTEQWRKHVIPNDEAAPDDLRCASAVVVNRDIYMFGGLVGTSPDNALWKLTRIPTGYFVWNKIEPSASRKPSPRWSHSSWAFYNKLWVFGGCGDIIQGDHFDEHGHFEILHSNLAYNNQLLSFDISCNTWTNPQCIGSIPSPGADQATTILGNKV